MYIQAYYIVAHPFTHSHNLCLNAMLLSQFAKAFLSFFFKTIKTKIHLILSVSFGACIYEIYMMFLSVHSLPFFHRDTYALKKNKCFYIFVDVCTLYYALHEYI